MEKQVTKLVEELNNIVPAKVTVRDNGDLSLTVLSSRYAGVDKAIIMLPNAAGIPATILYNNHGDGDIINVVVTVLVPSWPEDHLPDVAHGLLAALWRCSPAFEQE